nr:MAG TPA: hypothetical protein [Caudoviricetes sp.]
MLALSRYFSISSFSSIAFSPAHTKVAMSLFYRTNVPISIPRCYNIFLWETSKELL